MSEPSYSLAEQQFTVIEAAKHLKISRAYFYKLVAAKKIRVAKLGTRTIVPGPEVLRFLQDTAASVQ